ncbi:TPA: class I SAM-dependent methyltransferase [Enterobacter hormaechei subsp. xiangfangensis]|nr:class I SAM-dependent methyltransferase [Enterobacter hormaechei subsp. xiangfangensis]
MYAEHWKKESDLMDSSGVYEKLAALTPEGNVLEFGCGAGQGTRHLLAHHSVLSLDNNDELIEMAKKHIDEHGVKANIHQCDFFALSENDKQIINDFSPKVIVGWSIGGSGVDQLKHVPTAQDVGELSKSYREKIEDIITSPDVCIDSVEYIQIAMRALSIAGADKNAAYNDTKANYDQFVFGPAGFEVISVETMAWALEQSDFAYGHAHNPNFANGKQVKTVPVITSILAKRVKK